MQNISVEQTSVGDLVAAENRDLRSRLEAAEATLRAIRADEVDALMIEQGGSEHVRTLQGADEGYRSFVEVMCQGAATVASDGTILYCNRHCAELLRAPLEQMIGASIYEFVARPEEEGLLRAVLWEAMSTACVGKPFVMRGRDGSVISTVITATPLKVDGVSCACLVMTDLTEREARIAAEAASRAKDEFLANVSHELRTPLSAILLWSKLLEDGSLEESERPRALRAISAAAEAQGKLIEDLLDVSRILSGNLRLNLRTVDAAEIVKKAVETISAAAKAKKVRLEMRPQRTPLTVHGDPDRLQQIVWNLLNNAVKFTPADGQIDVTLERVDSFARIMVRDSGKGISAEFLPYVFDRFRQADATSARAHTGLGLGLAIARELAQMHGGTITAASDGDGRGSTFTVALPVAAGDIAPPVAPAHEPGAAKTAMSDKPLKGLRLLVVEDELATREVLSRVLELAGASVFGADSAAAAMEVLANASIDLIISDIGLPGEDGYSFRRRARKAAAELGAVAVPAIALTAYARTEDRHHAVKAGFEAYLSKPIDAAELVLTVALLTGRTTEPLHRSKRHDG